MSENVCESVRRYLDRQDAVRVPPAIDATTMTADLQVRRAEVRARLGLDGHFPVVLFAGNTSRTKNLAGMLEAFALTVNDLPSAVLVATTELNATSPVDEVESAAERAVRLGIAPRVIQLKIVDDMPALIAAADLVVTPFLDTQGPSDYFVVALEAMVLGTRVVSSPAGGMHEVVSDDRGLLVDPRNMPDLARAISSAALRDAPSLESIVQARQLFEPCAAAAAFEELYGAARR
jgi:glycosyltransferase involved in cell wall biosynthesis